MTGNTSSASAAATAASQVEGDEPDSPPAAPLLVMLGTIALGVWILFQLDEGGKQDNSIPISPA